MERLLTKSTTLSLRTVFLQMWLTPWASSPVHLVQIFTDGGGGVGFLGMGINVDRPLAHQKHLQSTAELFVSTGTIVE